MAPHSSTLAWKIPWTEEPGRLQSMESLGVRHNWATSLSLFISCIGEGNGNPHQHFCLENPRDGGASWAAIYGVTQSRTRLKRLRSSSSSSSRKGLAEEREAGDITDGRKREERKEEGNEVQSLDDGQQRETMPSSVPVQVAVCTKMLRGKGQELGKISGWCSFGVSVQISSYQWSPSSPSFKNTHLFLSCPTPTFSPWLHCWMYFPVVSFFILLLSVTSQKNVSSTKSKVLSPVHCCFSRSQKYPLLTEGAQLTLVKMNDWMMTPIFSSETGGQVACWGWRREPPWERWKEHWVMLKAQWKLGTWDSLWAMVFSKGSLQSPWRREEDIWMHPGVKLFQGQHNGKKRSKDILGTWQGLVEALDHGILPEEWRQQGTDGRRRRWKQPLW